MPAEPRDAVILAGGLGTRIAPVLGNQPKVLAPVHGHPFLAYLLRWLADSGMVSRVVIAAGVKGDEVAAYCAGADLPLPTEVCVEDTPLGTGGALLNALPKTSSAAVWALNGDSFVDADLAAMSAAHARHGAGATLLSVRVDDAAAFGTLRLDGDRITGFAEKEGIARAAWINAGVYLFERRVLARVDPGPSSLEYDILPGLAQDGLFTHRTDGPFIDIGTPERYARAEAVLPPLKA